MNDGSQAKGPNSNWGELKLPLTACLIAGAVCLFLWIPGVLTYPDELSDEAMRAEVDKLVKARDSVLREQIDGLREALDVNLLCVVGEGADTGDAAAAP